MKITDIKVIQEGLYRIFEVTKLYNPFEKFFGYKDKTIKLKETGSNYTFGGQNIYVYEDGTRTDNGDEVVIAIDKFRKKF